MMYCLVWQPFDPASKHPVYTSTPSLIGGTPARDGATTGESTACAREMETSYKRPWSGYRINLPVCSETLSRVASHFVLSPCDQWPGRVRPLQNNVTRKPAKVFFGSRFPRGRGEGVNIRHSTAEERKGGNAAAARPPYLILPSICRHTWCSASEATSAAPGIIAKWMVEMAAAMACVTLGCREHTNSMALRVVERKQFSKRRSV